MYHDRAGLILHEKKIVFRLMIVHQAAFYGKCGICSVFAERFRQVCGRLKVERSKENESGSDHCFTDVF